MGLQAPWLGSTTYDTLTSVTQFSFLSLECHFLSSLQVYFLYISQALSHMALSHETSPYSNFSLSGCLT